MHYQREFSSWTRQMTEYPGNYQDYVRRKAEPQDERILHNKKELTLKQELAWMRRQPQGIWPSNKAVSITFPRFEKRKFRWR